MDGHIARKRFGQNFLADPHYVARVVDAIAPQPGDNLVEIGPGLGALTRPLVAACGHIAAIEIDRDLSARLLAAFEPRQLTLLVTDALEFDFATLGDELRVVGNLPYYISSPLLFHLATFHAVVRDITVMLQREVAERMAARPATPEYGRLSVMIQARFAVRPLLPVPAGAFRPAPKVESTLVRLEPLRDSRLPIADEQLFARVVTAAFGQRRKTLRNALRALATPVQLEHAGIEPTARGETLALADFVRLANSLAADAARALAPTRESA